MISGEWVYQYCNRVIRKDKHHALLPLVAPLTQGTFRSNFKANFTLTSHTEWSTFSCMYGITTKSVVNVHKQFRKDNDTLLDYTYFPRMYENLNPDTKIEFPVLNLYGMWWNLIEANVSKFVDVYYHADDDLDLDQGLVEFISKVNPFEQDAPTRTFLTRSLKKIIAMMHFNNVLHELISANQSAFDVINRKRFHKVSKIPNTENRHYSMHCWQYRSIS